MPSPGPIVENPGLYGPVCLGNQLRTLWPDCGAISVFYQCVGTAQFVTRSCPAGTAFSFEDQVCIHMAKFEESAYCYALGQGAVPPIMDDNHHHVMPYFNSRNQNPLDDLVYKPAVESLPEFEHSALDGLIYKPAVESQPDFNQNPLDDLFYRPAVQE